MSAQHHLIEISTENYHTQNTDSASRCHADERQFRISTVQLSKMALVSGLAAVFSFAGGLYGGRLFF